MLQTIEAEWPTTVQEMRKMQIKLRERLVQQSFPVLPRLIVGLDAAFSKDGKRCLGAAILWDSQKKAVIEAQYAEQAVPIPYIPGYLSFREAPTLLQAYSQLKQTPELIMCDGHGIAHPRRLGIAAHIGVLLDRPSIGVGKSKLCGSYQEPGLSTGSSAPLLQGQALLGRVLRSKNKVRPLFVSPGHKMDIPSAVAIVMACCHGYRLPEPTRLADKMIALYKRGQA